MGDKKSDVSVKNTGNIPVYVRCKITVYEELKDQRIMNEVKDTDYELTFPSDFKENWIEINHNFYYKKPVKPQENTELLIKKCLFKQKGLVVDISAQTIQAEPSKAVQESWKEVTVDANGNLKKAGQVTP